MRNCMVHIVESPSPDDFFVERHEGAAMRTALTHARLPVRLYTAVDAARIVRALAEVVKAYQINQDSFPILHLSMHGNDAGIALTNGETLDWATLGDALSWVNEALHGKLVVVMSTCKGYSGVKMARRDGHAPFFALIGPPQDVAWEDTVAAFVAFYHHLIARDGAIRDSVAVINQVLRAELFQARKADDELATWRTEKSAADNDRLKKIAERIERLRFSKQ